MADPRVAPEAPRRTGSTGRHVARTPPSAGSPRPLTLAIIGLLAVAIAWFALDRTVSRMPSRGVHPLAEPSAVVVTPSPAPRTELPAASGVTAPALSRVAREREEAKSVTSAANATPAAPHPMPEQLAAASRIAATRRAEREREDLARVADAPVRSGAPARLAPPGRAVQLGVYDSAQQARAAAKRFRYRYRGLLASLPDAVLPYRPAGSPRAGYRVQFVVPSQAYAEITCQRLRAAQKACVVIY